MNTTLRTRSAFEIILIDLIALLVVYLVPSLSHVSPFPLHYAEPMRLMAIGVYFVSGNQKNALLLAFTMPLFSMLFTGHPVPLKALLISVELSVNVLLLDLLMGRFRRQGFGVLLGSILLSKTLYYLLKFLFISMSLLSGALFSIPIPVQVTAAIITAALFQLGLAGARKP